MIIKWLILFSLVSFVESQQSFANTRFDLAPDLPFEDNGGIASSADDKPKQILKQEPVPIETPAPPPPPPPPPPPSPPTIPPLPTLPTLPPFSFPTMPTLPPFSFSTPAPFVPSVPVTPAPVPAPVPVPVQSPLPVPVQAPLPAPVQAPLPAPAPASFVPQITPQVVPAQPALPIPVAAPTQPTINFIPAQGSRSIQLVPANQYKDRAELWFRENFDASACAKNPDEIAEKFLQKFPKKLLKNNKEVILAQLLSTRLKQCFEKQQKNTWNKANEQLANLKLSTSEENECRSGLVQEQISCLNVQSYACQFIHPKYNFRLVPTRIIIQEARLAEDGAEKCRKVNKLLKKQKNN